MTVAGTDETFCLKFLYFNYEDQRWVAECQMGDSLLNVGGAHGLHQWYVIGYPEVKVPAEVCKYLSQATNDAMITLNGYHRATGEYCPKELLQ